MTQTPNRRKYPRVKAPAGFTVAWNNSLGRRAVTRVDTVGMGGIFMRAILPPKIDSLVELLLDANGQQIRMRGKVSRSIPGKGAAVKFLQMAPEDRTRLNQLLLKLIAESGVAADSATAEFSAKSAVPVDIAQIEKEVAELLERAKTGTYYQLLGVTSEGSLRQLRERFYAFAHRYHPDHHMNSPQLQASLKELMTLASEAYRTLKDTDQRNAYDQRVAAAGAFQLTRSKSQTAEALDEYFTRATQYLKARNFAGSIVWLRKCVEMAPKDAKYRELLAASFSAIPQYRNEAIQEFQKALELNPWNVDSYLHLGRLYEACELPHLAQPLYLKALQLDPEHAEARAAMDRIHASAAP